jgi:hypothetical protein
MEVLHSLEKSVNFYQTTRRNILENSILFYRVYRNIYFYMFALNVIQYTIEFTELNPIEYLNEMIYVWIVYKNGKKSHYLLIEWSLWHISV